MKGIIYKWTCNRSGKSYIGQTVNESRREREFLSDNKIYTMSGSKIDNARKKYGVGNNVWKKEVLKRLWCKNGNENKLLERLNFWERYYIKKYDTFNNGYNSTNGGSTGFLINDEIREKCKYWLGKTRYASANEKNRQKQIGKKKDDFVKDKIRKSVLSHNLGKPIKQFSLNGYLIREYQSISEASKINGIKSDGIVKCARGLQKKCKGYIWKFSNEKDLIIRKKENKGYYFHKRLGKYKSRLRVNGKEYNLGFYKTEKAASTIYQMALNNKNKINEWYKNIEIIKQDLINKFDN